MGGLNLYRFVRNRSVNSIDLDGWSEPDLNRSGDGPFVQSRNHPPLALTASTSTQTGFVKDLDDMISYRDPLKTPLTLTSHPQAVQSDPLFAPDPMGTMLLGLALSLWTPGPEDDMAMLTQLRECPTANTGIAGVTSGEAAALARQIYGIEVTGQRAVSSVEAFGSRAGSTFRGRGPLPTSDFDIRITLSDPAHFGAVNAEMTEIGALFQSAKGFPLQPTYVIPGLPPPTLLQTPFILLYP